MSSTLAHRPPSCRTLAGMNFRACLGRDPFSETWEADDPDGRACLVKVLYGLGGRAAEGKRRLQELTHPALPATQVHAGGPGVVAVVQERPAATLRDRLAETRAAGQTGVAASPLLGWLGGAAAALDELARRGVPHLALQPRLIGLDGDRVVLLEHGVAALLWQPAGRLPGPLPARYAAPEILAGSPSPTCDVFSLAVLCHEALTGTPPFVAGQRTEADLSPLPEALRRVVARALDAEPGRRFACCSDLVAALWRAAGLADPAAALRQAAAAPRTVRTAEAAPALRRPLPSAPPPVAPPEAVPDTAAVRDTDTDLPRFTLTEEPEPEPFAGTLEREHEAPAEPLVGRSCTSSSSPPAEPEGRIGNSSYERPARQEPRPLVDTPAEDTTPAEAEDDGPEPVEPPAPPLEEVEVTDEPPPLDLEPTDRPEESRWPDLTPLASPCPAGEAEPDGFVLPPPEGEGAEGEGLAEAAAADDHPPTPRVLPPLEDFLATGWEEPEPGAPPVAPSAALLAEETEPGEGGHEEPPAAAAPGEPDAAPEPPPDAPEAGEDPEPINLPAVAPAIRRPEASRPEIVFEDDVAAFVAPPVPAGTVEETARMLEQLAAGRDNFDAAKAGRPVPDTDQDGKAWLGLFGDAPLPDLSRMQPEHLAEQFAPDGESLDGGTGGGATGLLDGDPDGPAVADPEAPSPDREALARALVHEVAAALLDRTREAERPAAAEEEAGEPLSLAETTSPWAAPVPATPAVPAAAPERPRFEPGPGLAALLDEARRAMPADEKEEWLPGPGGETLRCTFPASLPPGAPHGIFEGFRLQWGAHVVKAEDAAVVFHVGPQARFWQRWLGRSQGLLVTLQWTRPPETALPTVTARIRAAGRPGAGLLREVGPLLLDSLRVLMQGPPNRRAERRLVWPHPVRARFFLSGGQCSGEVSGQGKDLTSMGLGMYLPRILPGAAVQLTLSTSTLPAPVQVVGRFIRVQRLPSQEWVEAAVLFQKEV